MVGPKGGGHRTVALPLNTPLPTGYRVKAYCSGLRQWYVCWQQLFADAGNGWPHSALGYR